MNIINRAHGHRNTYLQLQGIIDMILDMPQDIRNQPLVEIGTYSGDAAVLFSLYFFPVVAIDPIGGTADYALQSADEIYNQFLRNVKDKPINHIRKTSDDVVSEIIDNSVACVYVDGFHSYEQCKKDIINYWPKIKEGGFMCGHDYGNEDTPGVTKAVQELFGEPDKLFIDWSWSVQKIKGRNRW